MTHYKQLPKSALVKNSVEIQNFLKDQYGIQNLDYVYDPEINVVFRDIPETVFYILLH